MRRAIVAAAVACGLGALAGAAAAVTYVMLPPRPSPTSGNAGAWAEVTWPFPIDQWGTGTAFRCEARACGTDIELFIRPKIGFCNCTTGVADDEELERVADHDLFGERRRALAPGRDISVRWMKGRSRAYAFSAAPNEGRATLTIAFNDRCDVIVATVVAAHNRPAELEAAALAFLNGEAALGWTKAALGL
jgi:hypothetical protein